jgi:cellobiose phosphorylase
MRSVVYNPGIKENAGIFNHTQGWGVMAECLQGNGNRAYEYFRATMPSAYNTRAEVRQSEPYVHAQTTYSIFSPRAGNTRTSWLTGAAAWSYFSATRYILGIQPEVDGLRIDPCVPSTWESYEVTRRFRNKTWRITIHNPEHVCRGVSRVFLDGLRVEGNLVLANTPGEDHQVEVWLGKNN